MKDIKDLVQGLTDKNDSYAYQCLKLLVQECQCSSAVYPYFDSFVAMLEDKNSYIRTRGLTLIASCARWDIENKIDGMIDQYLTHLSNEKPITARKCIDSLPLIAEYKPDLREKIVLALQNSNCLQYPDSMQSLVKKDVSNALRNIEKLMG